MKFFRSNSVKIWLRWYFLVVVWLLIDLDPGETDHFFQRNPEYGYFREWWLNISNEGLLSLERQEPWILIGWSLMEEFALFWNQIKEIEWYLASNWSQKSMKIKQKNSVLRELVLTEKHINSSFVEIKRGPRVWEWNRVIFEMILERLILNGVIF